LKRYTILREARPTRSGSRSFEQNSPLGQANEIALTVESLPDNALVDLVADPQVKSVSPTMPIRLIKPMETKSSADESNWGVAAVGADKSPFTGAGVKVAVLDTGIESSHPAFQGVHITQKNFTSFGSEDKQGHGTHCAGTILGRDVAGRRIGIARGVDQALIGKVLGDDGSGDSEALFKGMLWAMHEGADIISMSVGFDFPGMVAQYVSSGWPIELATSNVLEAYRGNLRMFDAIMGVLQSQSAFGVSPLVIAAAGNESRRSLKADYCIAASLPAAADNVISVAAIGLSGSDYVVADFSNNLASVAAPGVNITSAWPGGGFHTINGTSMACPHVAGVAALWWEAIRRSGTKPNAKNVTARLLGNSTKHGFLSFYEADFGQGLVIAPLAPL
jgi:subtilisin family serine protease